MADTGKLSRDYVKTTGPSGGAGTILGTSMKTAARFAAFVNGIAMHADDYDDTQLAVAEDRVYGLLTHPTTPVLSAALALAEAHSLSGKALMTAYHPATTTRAFTAPEPAARSAPPRQPQRPSAWISTRLSAPSESPPAKPRACARISAR